MVYINTMSSMGDVKRLTIEISPELHLGIRVAAAKKNQSMAAWIRDALQETIEFEEADEPVGQPQET